LMLPPEFQVLELAIAKSFPKDGFSRSLLPPQFPATFDQARKRLAPSPIGRGLG
jgi:hypothetical protein